MSKKILYRIPVCIFIFVVGSITALLFASVLNDVLTTGSISTDLTDFSTIFSGVFGGEKPRKPTWREPQTAQTTCSGTATLR